MRRDREKIAVELTELMERGQRLDKAVAENSHFGNLRRAMHGCGRPLKKVVAEAGLDVLVLCDFLEGTRALRSDMLHRAAVAEIFSVTEWRKSLRPETPNRTRVQPFVLFLQAVMAYSQLR